LAELGAQLLLHRASSAPVGVLFIDIDHFKRFNDDHGHATGDLALQTVARTLQAGIRPFDVVGRWGGEEFVAVFPNIMSQVSPPPPNVCRCSCARLTWRPFPDALSVRVSIGGAMVRADDTATTVLSRADAALYISKAAGRDRVTLDVRRLSRTGTRRGA
jgi:diguanylate cyclase (GGDEF)-like protein